MSDIFDEVEQDLRRERMKALWDRFGIYIVLGAVLIVVIVAGWRGYEAWQTNRAREAGDAFAAVLSDTQDVGTQAAGETLLAFAEEAPEGYELLARFRAATAFHQVGASDRSADILDGIAGDTDVPALYRELARVRLAQVELDAGNLDAAEAAAAALAENSRSPFNSSAQELMGVIAFAQSDTDAAERWFGTLAEASGVTAPLRQRAQVMLDLIAQNRTGARASRATGDAPDGPEAAADTADTEAAEETN